ncbi:MAG: DsbA family protein [Pyrinomonadaceae bacterium]|nr:DsbA family protein [Pyrinomonadaceae bacterium]
MKLFLIILLLFFCLNVFAQKPDEVLATANGQNFTAKDLAPEVQQELVNLPATLKNTRQALLDQQIADVLFEKEAAAQKISVAKLIETEIKAKVSAPTEKEVQAVYDANRAAVGNQTLEQVKSQIVAFLQRDAQQKAYANLISNLKSKYKTTLGKDVNAANLSRFEVLATVGDKQISVESFESKNKIALAELEADVYDEARASLEQIVYSNLIVAEAKTQNIETSDFIAREITDKLKDYTEAERLALESALRDRLFKKYGAKFTVKQIPPTVQTISAENQPSRGKLTAPVTVVMFTDFQCSACSATHPVLQEVLKNYGDKIRFVVRDFPLITIHENAYQAALAANAAHAQGKFFEYTEILYQNQAKLDEASLIEYASQVGLNVKQFEADLRSKKFAPDIEKDIADGKTLGLSGTPTIFVNGVKVRQFSPEGFRQAIDKAVKK